MIPVFQSLDIPRIRAQFPILDRQVHGRPLVYLDNAATTQTPISVLDAMDRYYRESNANIHRGVHQLSQEATNAYEHARTLAQTLLNAKEDAEVIFTKGCTESINLVAATWGRKLTPDDTILLSTMEHHANIVPWQMTSAKVVPIPIFDNGEIDLDAYRALLKVHRVKLVGIVHVSNSLGTVNPVREIIRLAHEAGAIVLVDGAQSAPHTPIDVRDIDADFYTVSGHKLYGPTGVGLLYGKRALLEAMPVYQGGGDMIRTVSFERTTFAEIPGKFEAGTPNIAGAIGLGAAISWLASLGSGVDLRSQVVASLEAIDGHERSLARLAEAQLGDISGVRLVGTAKDKAGIVSFTMDQAHPHDIGTILDASGVAVRAGHHCCMPLMRRLGVSATARASFAVYSSSGEVEALVRAVGKVAEVFA